uniref:Uncharacterized protein n=1 Tax=Eutreptiella gymnastica TaxID=73025 RepID=A0A7S1N802_9EUGL|mmetsp:Transcript_132003/g.228782  ORF Transcript_132003/g.228782 Transcript_132003/m.228782 type:complete len:117 (+) Transcript_132003:48-398(+)
MIFLLHRVAHGEDALLACSSHALGSNPFFWSARSLCSCVLALPVTSLPAAKQWHLMSSWGPNSDAHRAEHLSLGSASCVWVPLSDLDPMPSPYFCSVHTMLAGVYLSLHPPLYTVM